MNGEDRVFNSIIRVVVIEEVKSALTGSERRSSADTWRKNIPGGRNVHCETLKYKVSSSLTNCKEVNVLERWEWGGRLEGDEGEPRPKHCKLMQRCCILH